MFFVNNLSAEDDISPDLIMLTPIMFDYRGRDLVGRSIGEIESELGIPVDIP